jgi:hypothetical protein
MTTQNKWVRATNLVKTRIMAPDNASNRFSGSKLLADLKNGQSLSKWDPELCLKMLQLPGVDNYLAIKKMLEKADKYVTIICICNIYLSFLNGTVPPIALFVLNECYYSWVLLFVYSWTAIIIGYETWTFHTNLQLFQIKYIERTFLFAYLPNNWPFHGQRTVFVILKSLHCLHIRFWLDGKNSINHNQINTRFLHGFLSVPS